MCDAWLAMHHLEGQHVSVQTSRDSFQGRLHAVDPESGNILLLSADSTVHIIFASCITRAERCESVDSTNIPDDVLALRATRRAPASAMECDELVRRLRERRVEASVSEEDGGGKVVRVFDGMARIVAPFDEESVRGKSQVVVQRVRQLLLAICTETKHMDS